MKKLEWSKGLLDEGKQHTQKEWIELLKNSEYRLPTLKELWDYVSSFKSDNDMPKELSETLIKSWIMTSEKCYNPFVKSVRVIALGVSHGGDRFLIIADGGIGVSRPAFGVRKK